MAATLPLQEPGPGPTAQPLPSWLSYSAVTTLTSPYLSTVTRIVYYPDGSLPPTPTLQVDEGTQTSVQYSVIYRPLLYDGPFPAPPLGTLFTTEGQRVMPSQSEGMGNTPQPTQTAAPAPAPGMTPGDGQGNGAQGGQNAGNGQGGNGQAGNGQGTAGQGDVGQGGNNAQGGQPQDGGAGQAGSGNEQGQGGQAGQGTNGQGQPTQGSAQGDNGADTGSSATAGAFPIGTTGADGIFSPTATATAFPPGATPTDAAGSSSAAAAESSASASLASSISASLSSQSAASASSSLTSTAQPSDTGVAGVNATPDSGLSGGQIAGIVIGALLALLLLLLALLCCWRRRRRREEEADRAAGLTGGSMRGPGHQRRQLSDRWAAGFSRGGAGDAAQGTYAAIGAAGAGAGAGAAAGARENSDEWEEDQLRSGGSGFFVVGGREGRSDSIPTVASTVQRNRGAKRSALEALGLGAAGGIVAAAIGRRRSGNRGASQPVPTDEADVLSDEEAEGEDVGEKRGLMSFDESNAEMSEAGNRQSWIAPAAAAGAGAGGAGAYAAARQSNEDPFDEKTALAAQQHGEEQGQDLGSPSATRRTMTPSTSASSSAAAAAPGWGTTAAVAGVAAAAGAAAAGHRRNSDSLGGGYTTSGGYTSSQSGAGSRSGSGSGSRGGHAPSSRGGGTSTNSTGTRTVQGSPTTQQSLPPPPRAPRDRHGVTTYGNVAPAAGVNEASNASGKPRIPSFSGAAFGEGLGFDPARPSMDSSAGGAGGGSSNDHAGLYLGVAGAAGLGALAAGHRESGGSSYSKGAYATDEEEAQRHSRFISQNTPLLGPGASEDTRTQQQQQQQHLTPYAATGPATNYGHGRLPTIKSVGEFGEGGSGVHSLGSTGSSGGYARASLLSPTSEEQQAQTPVSVGTAAASAAGGAGAGTFYTPPGSPRGTLGQARSMRSVESSGGAPGRLGGATGLAQGSTDDEDAANPFADRSTSAHEYTDQRDDETSASGHGHQAQLGAAAAGGGLLGGLAAGWRRLTMGNTSTDPALVAERERELASPTRASDEAARDFSPRSHAARRDPAQASDPGLAAEVQSMRASVHQSSTLGHASPASGEAHSRATSGDPSPTLPSSDEQQRLSSAASSGERLAVAGAAGAALGVGATAATQQHGSGAASQRSSQPSTGYSASISGVSNNTSSRSRSGPEGSRRSVLSGASTGLDSLSQRAHVSEHSSSGTRSSGSRRTAASESGASTGAASYSPSVLRNSTTSTRGGATTAAGRRVPVPYEVTMEEEEDGYESEGQSSRATAGNNSSLGGGRKRPRSGSLDGAVGAGAARQLDSLREVQEAPIEDLYGHYPSASLGAAAMRQAYREAELQQAGAGAAGVSHSPQSSTSQTRTPRPLPRSLVAGIAAAPSRTNAQHTLSTSASTPSLRELAGAAGASSSAWRESPRVASASMRAAEAAAFLEASRAQQQQAAWGDLETSFPAVSRPSGLRNEEGAAEQQQQQQQAEEEARTSQWPKFLRF